MSSVMPASTTTCAPPRSRAWRTRATSQPLRATRNRPGSIARRSGRRSGGIASRSAGSSLANRSGAGAGAHGQATVGLGADVRIEPEEDIEWPGEGSTPCEAGERPGFGWRLDGEPANRPADARRADDGGQVVVGLAHPLDRDPLVGDA